MRASANTTALTITSSWTSRVVAHAKAAGLEVSAMLAELGIEEHVLEHPHGRVLFARHAALVERVATRLDEPGVGLDLGAAAGAADFGVVGLLAEACATLRDALVTIQRFNALANEASRMDYWIEGGRLFILDAHLRDGKAMPGAIAEGTMAFYATMIRHTSGVARPFAEVWFAHERHRGWTPARQHQFAATLRFGMPVNALVLPAELLDVPLVSARPELSFHLTTLAQHLEHGLAPPDEPSARVTAYVRRVLATGSPEPLHRAARALGTTTRTLQRELEAVGRTYSDLVDDVRRDIAATLLIESTLKVEAVAERAGYAEARSFRRACVRWFGVTPGEFRKGSRQRR